jgi:ABC-type Zn2+ transport system substrate-binding protein/surface adhesin
LREQVLATETRLRASLAPVSQVPLLLDHDFLDAFWPYFGLAEPLWIRRHPEQHPGTRHLLELGDALARLGSVCYLREAGAPPEPLAAGLGQQADLLEREIDVLGLRMDATTYPAWLQETGDTLRACLQAAQAQNAGKKKP